MTLPWPRDTFIALDTETTGLDFQEDRIIQIGVAVFQGSQYIHGWEWLLNTDKPSHEEAVATHGITDEYRWEHGQAAKEVIPRVMALVHRMQEHKRPIIVFNAPFDWSMLRAECERTGAAFYRQSLYVVDPLVIDRHYEVNVPVFTKPFMRQEQMAARYGVSAPNHTALADAQTAGYIAIGQTLHHPAIRHLRPSELMKAQEKWYEAWASKFVSFARKKSFNVSIPGWPFGNFEARPESVLCGEQFGTLQAGADDQVNDAGRL